MNLIELTNLYKKNRKQLLVNLTNIFKSTKKKNPKKKKKSVQNFFELKHTIKSFKASKFYYLKVLVHSNIDIRTLNIFLQRCPKDCTRKRLQRTNLLHTVSGSNYGT
jgi:hypothetical protein